VWLRNPPLPHLESEARHVGQWHHCGHPFIVARQRDEATLSLGFCLATGPETRPRRISVRTRHEDILRTSPPPALATVARHHPSLAALAQAALAASLPIRVFGSYMWQTLTGESHVTPASDLDTLIEVTSAAEAIRATTFLSTAASYSPLKIDGELSIADLGEIHWREFFDKSPDLLLKTITTSRLIHREALWN